MDGNEARQTEFRLTPFSKVTYHQHKNKEYLDDTFINIKTKKKCTAYITEYLTTTALLLQILGFSKLKLRTVSH